MEAAWHQIYILVFCAHTYYGCAPATLELADLASCETAKAQITLAGKPDSFNEIMWAVCVRKDSR